MGSRYFWPALSAGLAGLCIVLALLALRAHDGEISIQLGDLGTWVAAGASFSAVATALVLSNRGLENQRGLLREERRLDAAIEYRNKLSNLNNRAASTLDAAVLAPLVGSDADLPVDTIRQRQAFADEAVRTLLDGGVLPVREIQQATFHVLPDCFKLSMNPTHIPEFDPTDGDLVDFDSFSTGYSRLLVHVIFAVNLYLE